MTVDEYVKERVVEMAEFADYWRRKITEDPERYQEDRRYEDWGELEDKFWLVDNNNK